MKYLKRVFNKTAIAAGVTLVAATAFLGTDPADDFSFSLANYSAPGNYTLMSERNVAEVLADRLDLFPKSQVPKLAKHLVALCKEHRFDPAFILSMIQVESSFRVKAVSYAGAVGLMQLMPKTAETMVRDKGLLLPGIPSDLGERISSDERALMDPYVNLALGVAYLARLRDKYEGLSPYYLVAAYNVGPGRMDELISQKFFKPVSTKRYYEAIRQGITDLRYYRREI